jgi:hypothetical protein
LTGSDRGSTEHDEEHVVTTLPVPVTFELPNDAWRSVEPASVGVVNAAFAALRETDDDTGFTPVLSISGGVREDSLTLEEIADESLAVLAAQGQEVELIQRQSHGDAAAPGLTQLMGCEAVVDGRRYDIRQGQAIAAYVDVTDPSVRAVHIYTVTCTYGQFPVVGREFQAFMASLRPVPGDGLDGPDAS